MNKPFPAYKGDEPYVFVSYSHDDEVAVFAQIRWLQDHGINIFFDEGIKPGSEWSDAIASAIKESDHFVYFITPRSVESENCRRELNFAIEESLQVLAVHLEPTAVPDGIRLNLNNRQAILKPKLSNDAYRRTLLSALAESNADTETSRISEIKSTQASPAGTRSTRSTIWAVAIVVVLILGGGGVFFVFDQPSMPEQEAQNTAAKQKLAVLPLRNLSPDQDLAWLAEGLTEQLRAQINVWDQFNVLPGAFLRGGSIENIPSDVDLVIDGYFRGSDTDVAVSLNLINMTDRSSIWSRTFSAKHTESFELQRQIATSIALFFGESIGGLPAPSRPEAYEPFLTLLPHRWMGDHDQHYYWLERTLELDPDWSWGWAELAFISLRAATYERDTSYIDKSHAMLIAHNDDAERYFFLTESYRKAFFSEDLSGGEEMMRYMAEEFGLAQPYAWLMLQAGFYIEAEAFAQRLVEEQPFDNLGWQILTVARGNLADAQGALNAARELERLYPLNSSNTPVFLAWALPNADRLEESHELITDLEHILQQKKTGTVQQKAIEQLAYYPLVFEVAFAEGNLDRAAEAADWFAGEGMYARAGIFYLRLNDPRASDYLAREPEPYFDRFFWSLATMHLTPQLRKHPLVIELEDKLGFTQQFRLELCEHASTLLPASHFSCDPKKYALVQ